MVRICVSGGRELIGSESCLSEVDSTMSTICARKVRPHRFCFRCAHQNALEGFSRREFVPICGGNNGSFDLVCFSGGECNASFSRAELQKFLDPGNYILFERIRSQVEFEKVKSLSL